MSVIVSFEEQYRLLTIPGTSTRLNVENKWMAAYLKEHNDKHIEVTVPNLYRIHCKHTESYSYFEASHF